MQSPDPVVLSEHDRAVLRIVRTAPVNIEGWLSIAEIGKLCPSGDLGKAFSSVRRLHDAGLIERRKLDDQLAEYRAL